MRGFVISYKSSASFSCADFTWAILWIGRRRRRKRWEIRNENRGGPGLIFQCWQPLGIKIRQVNFQVQQLYSHHYILGYSQCKGLQLQASTVTNTNRQQYSHCQGPVCVHKYCSIHTCWVSIAMSTCTSWAGPAANLNLTFNCRLSRISAYQCMS